MAYVFCNRCGHRNPPTSSFCSACGAVLDLPDSRTLVLPLTDALQDGTSEGDNATIRIEDISEFGTLVIRSGELLGQRIVLKDKQTQIGRGTENDFVLDDITVSRNHAIVERSGRDITVRDRGSLNGTYVNQVRVDSSRLEHGDELQIGRFKMVLFIKPDPN